MRNKGAIWTLAIALVLVCLYQLSFTIVTYKVRKDAQQYAQDEQNVIDLNKQDYYLDSIASEPVYNFLWLKKYTYRECQEREINLGLDLQGGMNLSQQDRAPADVHGHRPPRFDRTLPRYPPPASQWTGARNSSW